jgi:hypothetical protein
MAKLELLVDGIHMLTPNFWRPLSIRLIEGLTIGQQAKGGDFFSASLDSSTIGRLNTHCLIQVIPDVAILI